ncbi:MAG: hypothetical protein HC814_06865 [Rhodobacteraceae bacterium]|nr:hypothetical protein [Paracoccaceae bacterium]
MQEFGNFGYAAAALNSNRVIISANQIDEGANSAVGRAYLFDVAGPGPVLLATMTNPVPTPGSYFGSAVAGLTGNRVLVGAPEADRSGLFIVGEAYLFGTNGNRLRTFANPFPGEYAYFGESVAGLSSGLLLIGAGGVDEPPTLGVGRAYLYDTNGMRLRTFSSPVVTDFASFGYSLAPLGSNRVFIGAFGASIGAFDNTGSAYLYHTNGALLQTFTNPFPANGAGFGFAIAALGMDRVVIGAYGASRAGATNVGEAYLFRTNGTLLAVLTNPVPVVDAAFGGSITVVDGDKIIVGADGADRSGASDTGEAYLFSTNGTLLATFTNPAGTAFDRFSWVIAAVNSNRFLATAPQFTPTNTAARAGGAYVMTLPPLPGSNVSLSLGGNSGSGVLSWQSIEHRLLQETTNLTPTVVWTNSLLTVKTNGVTNSATVPWSNGPPGRLLSLALALIASRCVYRFGFTPCGPAGRFFRETPAATCHNRHVNHLTRREQLVLAGVLAMLLVGLAVKWYRTVRPPAITVEYSP